MAQGKVEREAALTMVARQPPRRMTGDADEAQDVRNFTEGVRALGAASRLAQNLTRRGGSTIHELTTGHEG